MQQDFGEICIKVKDNGVGIKDEDKDRLFKLFGTIESTRTKINLKGIGLGLVISRLIAEKFNGKVNFSSEFGQGTTFWFSFKLDQMDQVQLK